jgi:enoyl-CoA hydratase
MIGDVITEIHDRIIVITLNRPDSMNAITTGLAQGLLSAIEQLNDDPSLTVGVLQGAGRGFCSGMDLKAFAAEGPPRGVGRLVGQGSQKPLVAAIEGFAYAGGLELALICDLIVASEDVLLGIPEVGVGLFAAGGGLLHLPRRLPYSVAMEMALTGRPITALDAHEYGLVNRVTAPGNALQAALDLARDVAQGAPRAVAASKQLIRQAVESTEHEFWNLQRPMLDIFQSADAVEGARAFAEKRSPAWSGR